MKDEDKSKGQLIDELRELRRQVATWEQTKDEHKQSQEQFTGFLNGLLSLGVDPLKNVTRLTATCGELLHGTCAFYNRLEGGMLCAVGRWNAPEGYNPVDKPDGHICLDVISKGLDETTVVRCLPQTHYAETDPNVTKYNLQTYIGHPVKFGKAYIGSLCVVYTTDVAHTENDRLLIRAIASAIAREEQRKRAEDAQSMQVQFLQTLMEAIPDPVFYKDVGGKYLGCNQAFTEWVGLPKEKIIGKTVHGVVSNEIADMYHRQDLETLTHRGVKVFESSSLHPDGSLRSTIVSKSTYANADGSLGGLIGVISDVSSIKKAEEALKLERQQLLSIFDSINQVISVVDSETYEILYTNKFMKDLHGKELVGSPCFKELHGMERPCCHCAMGIAKSLQGEPYEWEYHNPTNARHYLATDRIIKWTDGRDAKFHLGIDITERKKVEEERERSLSLLLATLESTADGILVIDTEGKISAHNQEFVRMWRIPDRIIESRNDEEALSFVLDQLKDPEDFLRKVRDLYSHPDAESFDVLEFKDGRIFERFSRPQHLGDNIVGRVWSFRDVTDRERAWEGLERTEQFLNSVVDNLPVALFAKSAQDGQFILWNKASEVLFGFTKEQVIGKTDYDFFPEVQSDFFWKKDCESFESGEIIDIPEEPILTKNMGTRILHTKKVPVYDKKGQPSCLLGISEDISERKQAESAIRERDEALLAEKRLSDAIIDSIPGLFYLVDSAGRFIRWNKNCETISGYSGLEISKMHRSDFHLDEEKEIVERAVNEVFAKGEASVEANLISKDGNQIAFFFTGSRVIFDDKYGYLGIGTDITERKKAEEALREREQQYRLLADNALDVIWQTDLDMGFTYVNPAIFRMMGYTPDEFIGTRIKEHCDEENFMKIAQIAAEEISKGADSSGTTFETVLLRKNKDPVSVEVHGKVVFGENGLPIGFQGVSRDITDRLRAEEAVRQSEEWYRTLVENSFDGIFIQRGPKIIFANSRLCDMLGYSQKELEGLDHWLVYHPEYQKITRERARALMLGEDIVTRYEVQLQRKDGATFEGEISARAVRVQGEPGVQVWIRDVSARKRSEEVQLRLATAVEQAAEAIVVTDTAGEIKYVNPAFEQITGYKAGEVIGRNSRILKSGEHEPSFYKNLWETISRGEVWRGRFINKRRDGRLYHEDATISPVRDAGGKITNFVAVKRDITEHLQLTRQLLQAQKMEAIGTLAGGIAHDFNNLLQVTLGFSELLLGEKKEGDPEYDHLMKIIQAAESGAELVQALLMFGRKVEPKSVPLNINRQVMLVQKLLRRIIPKMIDIQMHLSADLTETNGDPTQLEQVLMNLGVNARDAMPDGGRLTLGTRNVTLDEEYCSAHLDASPGEYVLFQVSDTGHGMDKATLEHIFEPFYTTKELGRGTGLGLATVYGIVKQHGGSITCTSEVGHGTTFNIYLPAIESQTEPEIDKSAEMPALGTETVLLVDDEEFVRDLGERILKKSGYTVLTAANGLEALNLYGQHRGQVDLIILDLIMPTMGGKECLRELLKIDSKAKVLIASGHAADVSTTECLAQEAKGFVGKPFRFKELLKQVRKTLDER